MKVHRVRNEWRVRPTTQLMLLLFVFGCMLIRSLQYTLAAIIVGSYNAVDSEIFGVNSTSSINNYAWPPMQNHDIWSEVPPNDNDDEDPSDPADEVFKKVGQDGYEFAANSFDGPMNMEDDFGGIKNDTLSNQRQGKVLHIFPVPVDGECLSDDGRRTGTCFNAYECRQKGGEAKGECAMGFGVCCIFVTNCNTTISNNITYLVSPQFPSFMPNNLTSCSIRVELISEDISQLRIDFNHFSLGQPNRRTGVCDGDVFNISGGPGGTFSLCGQNSGQHLYYDVGGRSLPRQTLYGSLRPPTLAQLYPNLNANTTETRSIEISMNFAQRFLPIRLWEIRIAQIPFSQRAPAGCLQYHHGVEGVIQTFNFADNGRHLANQHYRVCIRQEMEMCSIMYQPCDEQSFRIGPSRPFRVTMPQQNTSGGGAGPIMLPSSVSSGGMQTNTMAITPAAIGSDDAMSTAGIIGSTDTSEMSSTSPATMGSESSVATMRTTSAATSTTNTTTPAATNAANDSTTAMSTTATTVSTTNTPTMTTTTTTTTTTTMTTPTSTTTSTTTPATWASDDVEGSGDEDEPETPWRRPRPVSGGGFDLLGFLRSAFELGLGRRRNPRNMLQSASPSSQGQQRQIYSTCTDRITLPCIIEDFIGTGLGPLPNCEPVHCGAQFCSSGIWPCRIESTVTPFFINIHFGDGAGKGSAEDNIGACLRYTQMQCM